MQSRINKIFGSVLFAIAVLMISSCSAHIHTSGKVPPGQAKKMTGDKSAKAYAPGQQKKN
ncbi:hypothetical protein [Flavobacterium sp. SORGH_AS_0622]|uniref:hypothetical protein n=1 Tax=Flavobacterium sp. SORGH_AS_0622 TaxID=3041772 RepID=UPI0027D82D42|nr:hypothetical protein [Flavobacterium sp. SORGH_AS_0622]